MKKKNLSYEGMTKEVGGVLLKEDVREILDFLNGGGVLKYQCAHCGGNYSSDVVAVHLIELLGIVGCDVVDVDFKGDYSKWRYFWCEKCYQWLLDRSHRDGM